MYGLGEYAHHSRLWNKPLINSPGLPEAKIIPEPDDLYHPFPLQAGLSYASVGNAPPVLGVLIVTEN